MNIAKFIYKCLNKTIPINFHTWFTLTTQIHNYNTRSKVVSSDTLVNTKNIYIQTARTSHYGLKKIKIQGAKIWNKLPPTIRIKNSISLFNKELKRYFVENYK